ncbi:MAG: EAL domain-containing protein [Desulfovibrio sp.]|nr:EAL domain-containing protein [Desulfovibrio sp.]
MNNFNEGYSRWTPGWHLLGANAAFLRLMGIRAGDASSEIPNADRESPAFYEFGKAVMRETERQDAVKNFEFRLWRGSGGHCWVCTDAWRISNAEGETAYYEAYVRDVTPFKLKEAEFSHQLFYDLLTGLPNRELFTDRLQMALETQKRHPGMHHGVLSLDLRNFKNINRHYGRNFGDMVLRHVATVLGLCCRTVDTVARTSSDGFSVLLHGPETGAQLVKIIKRIKESLAAPFTLWEQSMDSVEMDIGVLFPLSDYSKAESVLRDVSIAVSRAQAVNNKSNCKFFSKKMLEQNRQDIALSVILREKSDIKGFYLLYQPIVRGTGGLHSFEALARWQHNGKTIPPTMFIPIAEKTGFIKRLGFFFIEEAIRQMQCWQKEHNARCKLHVNISPYQFLAPDFSRNVLDILHNTGFDASSLLFEVTESSFLYDFRNAARHIGVLRENGIAFCLDDFGTGYSSLSYLKQMPIDCLKIDRSFVEMVDYDHKARILLKHILDLGEDMGYELVVEGVEKQIQLDSLGDLSRLLIQGYYFYKPLPPPSVEALFEEQK